MGTLAYLCCLTLALRTHAATAELSITGDDRNEHNSLILKRVGENLTLACAPLDGPTVAEFTWSLPFLPENRSRLVWTENDTLRLFVDGLQTSDAGQYTCESVASGIKAHAYVAVRPANPSGVPYCSSSMFFCGDNSSSLKAQTRCIPVTFLCDGKSDCPLTAKDEAFETCGTSDPCADKLPCREGRCIPKNWCCNGRWGCVPHPCCAEHIDEDFPLDKTGGGLKKYNEPFMLKATLYKACACFFVIITTATILISAICRARLKRISNRHLETSSPNTLERLTNDCDGLSGQNCQYSLVCNNDNDSFDILRHINQYPPSYSEVASRHVQNCSESNSSTEHLNGTDAATTPNPNPPESLNINNSPATRPNDFGMGLIANAIFNSRYRPVPQQNIEVTSIDYATDSDSSCRSPTAHPNASTNLGSSEYNSHFYGERIGGTPDMTVLQNFSDNRRSRQSNALDRILDRFGLNAPYNVDIDRNVNPAAWECRSFISPPDYNNANFDRNNGNSLLSFWSRLKNRFGRNSQIESSGLPNNVTVTRSQRRRPDTPDVPETTFNTRNPHGITASFDHQQFELYGRGFRYLRPQNCFGTRDMQNFPPPYSRVGPDPPPPYVSRENLLVATEISDQNGNPILDTSNNSREETTNMNELTGHSTLIESALNICDDNGNLDSVNSVHTTDFTCDNCNGALKCSDHRDISLLNTILQVDNEAMVDESQSNKNSQIICDQNPSTSTVSDNMENSHSLENGLLYNMATVENSGNLPIVLNKNQSCIHDKFDKNIHMLDKLNKNASEDNISLDQFNSISVPDGIAILDEDVSIIEASLIRTTDVRGLIFPPQNLEFIDADANVEYF